MTGRTPSGRIPGPVVGQYFAFFNGVPKQRYEKIVARAPFEDCNLLILAFVRAIKKGDVYVAQFPNWRDNGNPSTPGDSDQDRVKLVTEAARAKNPSLKILISLGWADKPRKRQELNTVPWNDAGHAATSPGPFAESMASIVQTFGLDGIDIDYESTDVEPKNMLTLARQLKQALSKVSPKREMILTIAPAQPDGLDASVLQAFTYTMPQTYDHGGADITATWYERQLGSFDRIVYGLNSEGYDRRLSLGTLPHLEWDQSDDPKKKAAKAKANKAAGIFAWRLDNDSLDKQGFPTFATGIEMWKLMTSTASTVDA
jgi:GH18 family chitinase